MENVLSFDETYGQDVAFLQRGREREKRGDLQAKVSALKEREKQKRIIMRVHKGGKGGNDRVLGTVLMSVCTQREKVSESLRAAEDGSVERPSANG